VIGQTQFMMAISCGRRTTSMRTTTKQIPAMLSDTIATTFSQSGTMSCSSTSWPTGTSAGDSNVRHMRLSEESARNRLHWDQKSDEYQAAHGDQLGRHQLAWGVWSISEDQLHVLGDVRAKDVLELGCGGAQWSIALEKRGARCVGLDNSARQLEHARRNADRAQTTAGRDNLLHRFRQLRMGRLVAGGANLAR
jgi:hypothetical protein